MNDLAVRRIILRSVTDSALLKFSLTLQEEKMVTLDQLSQHRRAVGFFPSLQDAEYALNELKNNGFSMDRVSIIARDPERHDEIAVADTSAAALQEAAVEGAGTGAVSGTLLGSIAGLLIGLGVLEIPGVGSVIAAGTLGTTLATTLAGAGFGAASGGFIGGLTGLDLEQEQDRVYSERLSRGEYLVIIDGTDAEISKAESILSNRGVQDWGIYNIDQAPILAKEVRTSAPTMIKVELDIAGTPPGGRPFEGYRTAQFSSLPRIREYIVLDSLYYEVDKIFYWEGERPPRLILRYAGPIKAES